MLRLLLLLNITIVAWAAGARADCLGDGVRLRSATHRAAALADGCCTMQMSPAEDVTAAVLMSLARHTDD